jgi:hypothetical protein
MIAFIWGAWMLQSTISVRYRIKLPSSLALIGKAFGQMQLRARGRRSRACLGLFVSEGMAARVREQSAAI